MSANTVLWWCANLYFINTYDSQVLPNEEVNPIQREANIGYLISLKFHGNTKLHRDVIVTCVGYDLSDSRFDVIYQWTHLNYSWESEEQYYRAITLRQYIPENNAPTGMKIFHNTMFLTVPRFRRGVPATLVALDMNIETNFHNPTLTPYPSWEFNDDTTRCSNLQSVQSMEIDTRGVMWVIDGVRIYNYTRCPTKLVLLNLNNGGSVDLLYVFPDAVTRQNGGFLNDIVVDETDGDFAYITDHSLDDPGIVVYSRKTNRSWKLRDSSMYAEPNRVEFQVEDYIFNNPAPVDGIALSPRNANGKKTLFYCAVSSLNVYSLPTEVIKNIKLVESGQWRQQIRLEGEKDAQSDGLMIDEQGTMFLTLIPRYGVAAWNIQEPFSNMVMFDMNLENMVWPDSLGMDQQGYLYLIANKIFNYIDLRRTPMVTTDTPFRILRTFTGTRSYLYG